MDDCTRQNGSRIADLTDTFSFTTRLSTQGKDYLIQSLQVVHYEEGILCKEEEQKPEALLLLCEGVIRVFKSSPGGRELTLYTINPGGSCMLAAYCILRNKEFPANAVAQEYCEALAIPAKTFRLLHAREPAVQEFVVDLGLHEITDLIMLVEEVAFRKVDERLAGFLLREAVGSDGALQPVHMTHEEIATNLGTAREVVSRLLNEFQSTGLIQMARRCVAVHNPERLKSIAQASQKKVSVT